MTAFARIASRFTVRSFSTTPQVLTSSFESPLSRDISLASPSGLPSETPTEFLSGTVNSPPHEKDKKTLNEQFSTALEISNPNDPYKPSAYLNSVKDKRDRLRSVKIASSVRNLGIRQSNSFGSVSSDFVPSKRKKQKSRSSSSTTLTGVTPLKRRTRFDLPHAYKSFSRVTPAKVLRRRYSFLKADERLDQVEERIGGRITALRHMGAIIFLTVRSDSDTIQVIRQVSEDFSREELKAMKENLRVGDIIGAVGTPGRTIKGELSLYAKDIRVLAPYTCADQTVCPDLKGFTPLADQDIRYRYRFLDLMTNPETVRGFQKRHAIIRTLRDFLDEKGFTEVETPMLHEVPSGANAKPFTTYHEGNETSLYLRVAPELYLKQCVVGGMERVYEIGRVFRNEDSDRSHNPEFTSCELYSAYDTYEDLMPLTEDLLRRLAMAANGSTIITVESVAEPGQKVELDLSKPFRRVSAYEAVEAAAGVQLPPPMELNTPRGLAYLSAILLRYNVPLPSVRTASKMFDKLIEFFITDRTVEPIFVTNHPLCMSPLAKAQEFNPGLAERFELYINGVEYCNAYSELNDPEEQFFRFQQQLMDRRTGDDEAMCLDETFLKSLQVGLPPTAGWGLGVDRLVALLNHSSTIRDVIFCPLLRADSTSRDGKRRRKTASLFSFTPRTVTFVLHSLEEEMRRRGMPMQSCNQIRDLHQLISRMYNHQRKDMNPCASAFAEDQGIISITAESNKRWLQEMVLLVLQIFCGRSNR